MKGTILKAPRLVNTKSGKELIVTEVQLADGEEMAVWSYPDSEYWVLNCGIGDDLEIITNAKGYKRFKQPTTTAATSQRHTATPAAPPQPPRHTLSSLVSLYRDCYQAVCELAESGQIPATTAASAAAVIFRELAQQPQPSTELIDF